jgi:hypothetical protein
VDVGVAVHEGEAVRWMKELEANGVYFWRGGEDRDGLAEQKRVGGEECFTDKLYRWGWG